MDKEGNLYGTTNYGGANHKQAADGDGTVFKVSPTGKVTVLYSFCSQAKCADGEFPFAGLIMDKEGNLYGTTAYGGASSPCSQWTGCGAVFKLAPPSTEGGAWTETVLHSFDSQRGIVDGNTPYAGLVMDKEGNLYGTTGGGGASNRGTVFELTPTGQETVLYSFCSLASCADGAGPTAGLIMDDEGNLYGTTSGGGTGDCVQSGVDSGCGTVFKVTP
jgi:uncharacterized repeat protein (TIGR03803 family)